MADRDSFNARIEKARRNGRAHRPATMDDASPATRNSLEWIAGVITDVLMFGWLWTLQGLAFAVLAGLAFLRFLGFEVEYLLMGAFVVVVVLGLLWHSNS